VSKRDREIEFKLAHVGRGKGKVRKRPLKGKLSTGHDVFKSYRIIIPVK